MDPRVTGNPRVCAHGPCLVHIDMKGAPPSPAYLLSLLPHFQAWGITGLLIEWEDAFPYSGPLEFLKGPDAYSLSEVEELLRAASALGLAVVPLVQCAGHLEFALKHPQLAHLRESPQHSIADLCPLHSGAWALVRQMVGQVVGVHAHAQHHYHGQSQGSCHSTGAQLAGSHESSRSDHGCGGGGELMVHIGCDEVFHLGHGWRRPPLPQRPQWPQLAPAETPLEAGGSGNATGSDDDGGGDSHSGAGTPTSQSSASSASTSSISSGGAGGCPRCWPWLDAISGGITPDVEGWDLLLEEGGVGADVTAGAGSGASDSSNVGDGPRLQRERSAYLATLTRLVAAGRLHPVTSLWLWHVTRVCTWMQHAWRVNVASAAAATAAGSDVAMNEKDSASARSSFSGLPFSIPLRPLLWHDMLFAHQPLPPLPTAQLQLKQQQQQQRMQVNSGGSSSSSADNSDDDGDSDVTLFPPSALGPLSSCGAGLTVWSYSPDVSARLPTDIWTRLGADCSGGSSSTVSSENACSSSSATARDALTSPPRSMHRNRSHHPLLPLWAAGCFRGATAMDAVWTPALTHCENVASWREVAGALEQAQAQRAQAQQGIGFDTLDSPPLRGMILTGWARFTHATVLCDSLPAGLPSLALAAATWRGGRSAPGVSSGGRRSTSGSGGGSAKPGHVTDRAALAQLAYAACGVAEFTPHVTLPPQQQHQGRPTQ